MSKRSGDLVISSTSVRQPTRKRQRLITSKIHNKTSENTKAPNADKLRAEFEETITGIDQVCPRQSNLEELIEEWNERISEISHSHSGKYSNNNNNNIYNLTSRLDFDDLDFKLIKQISSLTKETLTHAIELRNHSNKCIDIMLNKLQQKKNDKKQQINMEKMEMQIKVKRVPTKDIWSLHERINYFKEGAKAAIKTQIFNGKLRKMEHKYIVTKIVRVNNIKKECLLMDTDNSKKECHYTKSFKNIMPLPSLSVVSLAKRTIFKAKQIVLAVYPSTTCFYKAKIIKLCNTKYSLKFEDDGDKIKDIEAENVMPYVS